MLDDIDAVARPPAAARTVLLVCSMSFSLDGLHLRSWSSLSRARTTLTVSHQSCIKRSDPCAHLLISDISASYKGRAARRCQPPQHETFLVQCSKTRTERL